MMGRGRAMPPSGYERVRAGTAEVVALPGVMPGVLETLRDGTLYDYAASHAVEVMQGRAPAYVVPLPGGGPNVVVRHSRHGGLLAPLTGDRFLGGTRAPTELAMSVRLTAMGVPTPTLVAYVVYAAGRVMRRSDVATRLVEPSADLAGILTGRTELVARADAVSVAAHLLAAMARAGVRHPDLNLKNILVAVDTAGAPRAYLLDVDRVRIEDARARAAAANAARLGRSIRKWRMRHAAPITEAEAGVLVAAALGHAP